MAIDLEVDPQTNRIFSFAAVSPTAETPLAFERGDLKAALEELDNYCADAQYIVGHNIIDFDIPHLAAASPTLRLLRKYPVDTLRLNPLAFPRNPYHRLVKHYQDGVLVGGDRNNPQKDAQLTLDLLDEQIAALVEINHKTPAIMSVLHWLVTREAGNEGHDAVFCSIREAPTPTQNEAEQNLRDFLQDGACRTKAEKLIRDPALAGWPLAYAISWLTVAGGDSVMPPWVRHRFPMAGQLVRELRDTNCGINDCRWCQENNNPNLLLKRWFGFDRFRPEPRGPDGRSLQEIIVTRALAGESLLGILPTGTGKSLCYQIPALAKFDRIGALTVVISPLVALMADQVDSLRRQGITSCTAINGLLSLPERHQALEQVRLGETSILLISPEQLRSPSITSVLQQREIGYWVVDEAHCLSKWGHDFRPDYRYLARFAKQLAGESSVPPILCLTATAKPGVIVDIVEYFSTQLGISLDCVDGGALRLNLEFSIRETNSLRKLSDISEALSDRLPRNSRSGAIVYCSTRGETERLADHLRKTGVPAEFFHAGLPPERKREVQEQFRQGELRVIAATSAFGMGIDKPDIRLVVHGDIPSSLESYLQEAGRAGRDREPASCVLFYDGKDVERQFGLVARSRLSQRDVSTVLTALRRLDRRLKQDGTIVVTPGEIIQEDTDAEFVKDSATDDARIKSAIGWLEEARLLVRDENRVSVYPSCLKVPTLDVAQRIVLESELRPRMKRALIAIVGALFEAPIDRGITTDDLSGVSGLKNSELRRALQELERLRIATNDTAVTVFVHVSVERASIKRLEESAVAERELINLLRENAADMVEGDEYPLRLCDTSQKLQNLGVRGARPDVVRSLLQGIAKDGRDEEEGIGSIRLRPDRSNRDGVYVRLQRSWDKLARAADLRRIGSQVILRHLEDRLERGKKGNDLQVETTLGLLFSALEGDMQVRSLAQDLPKLLDRCLIWMHEQKIITLGKGLSVFRPAMTIRLTPSQKRFTVADFEPLQLHYDEQIRQIHIMAEYAQRGLSSLPEALQLVSDYFTQGEEEFLSTWMKDIGSLLHRQTTPESWRTIVESLGNAQQIQIVSDDREQTNVLVLAGPGSGKTRVLVHRIAYLIRVKRQDPRGILALAYNRHSASEIRSRLVDLIGDEAKGVTIATCHGLAMRLIGTSFAERNIKVDDKSFEQIMKQAVLLLRGSGLSREEAEAQREAMIQGYRWILVDEYQDIGPDEYDLISEISGRKGDTDGRLSLFAVGDDDQNIYAFNGASVDFIRRFEADYNAKPVDLIENYRSTHNIIQAANVVIGRSANRMKAGRDITVNRLRRRDLNGGELERVDSIGRGRVQIIASSTDRMVQAVHAVDELIRLSKLDMSWNWARAAVIGRSWKDLDPVRSLCEARGIPVQLAGDETINVWRLREVQALKKWVTSLQAPTVKVGELMTWLDDQPLGSWWKLLREAFLEFQIEVGEGEFVAVDLFNWLADWGRKTKRKQVGLLLVTAHSAKGLEFDDVVVLDGEWGSKSKGEDCDAPRRLFYVAMTRARRSLALMWNGGRHAVLDGIMTNPAFFLRRPSAESVDTSPCRRVYRRLRMEDVYIDFVGTLPPGSRGPGAVKALAAGDPIRVESRGQHIFVLDVAGAVVGRLAKDYRFPNHAMFVEGRVYAILSRSRSDVSDEFQNNIKCDEWETVVPEFAFDLEGHS